jgi:pimeloyl-ACP methyl ester carboxylesterase
MAIELECRVNKPKTQYVKCDDLYIAYQVFGDGPIDLVYVQGWLTNIEYAWESPDYARFLQKLARFSRVIFFDKRGCGMSDRTIGAPTLEERTKDIIAILDAIGSERAALFGTSEGGAISTMFAATYPERTSHLILCGSRPAFLKSDSWQYGTTPDKVETVISDMLARWGDSFPLTTGAPSAANDPATADWFAAYLRSSASPTAAAAITRMQFEIDYRDILSSIHVPTLVFHREGDMWVPVECAHYLAEHIEGAQLCIRPGEDHLAWYGDQDSLVREVEQFVTGEVVAARPERMLLTMVFMDIVDSTGQLAKLGDERWMSILRQLDVVVDRRVEASGGERIKHTGDGYLFAFRGPTSAAEYAHVIRDDAMALGLQTRIGIHTGECERYAQDLGGLAVHITARIMSEAEPQRIMASQTVKDLMAGSEMSFSDAGTHQLRGVPGDWSLYYVNV